MCTYLATLFPIITVGPFTKWAIDFTTYNPTLAKGHKYIIVVVEYFAKWVEAMPTFTDDGETITIFLFNRIISRFVEWEIPSLKLAVELLPDTYSLEERLIHLEHFNEKCQDVATINEAHKKRVKNQYHKTVHLRVLFEGDLVLVYDQDKDTLGAGKFKPIWYGPFIIKKVFKKGAYELVDFDGNVLSEPINGLYIKKYYP
eukprot:PITA_03245